MPVLNFKPFCLNYLDVLLGKKLEGHFIVFKDIELLLIANSSTR